MCFICGRPLCWWRDLHQPLSYLNIFSFICFHRQHLWISRSVSVPGSLSIHRLYTKCEIKRVSLHAFLHVCVCDCMFTCTLIAVADMASCLVRLITPLSAALGSVCWWIPQQKKLLTGNHAWSMTDYWCSRLLALPQQGERKRKETVWACSLS